MASGEVRIFSRHIADTTDKMEEAAALFRDDSPAEERLARFPRSFVLDCEIVAVQIPEEEDAALRLLPMQVRISLRVLSERSEARIWCRLWIETAAAPVE
jgi:ATP-dependent DNA ligase